MTNLGKGKREIVICDWQNQWIKLWGEMGRNWKELWLFFGVVESAQRHKMDENWREWMGEGRRGGGIRSPMRDETNEMCSLRNPFFSLFQNP